MNVLSQLQNSSASILTSAVVHGTVIHSQYAGEITVKALGVDVDIFDSNGQSCPLGIPGDLVIKKPFPNAAVKFWNDPNFERYRAAYFTQFQGKAFFADLNIGANLLDRCMDAG